MIDLARSTFTPTKSTRRQRSAALSRAFLALAASALVACGGGDPADPVATVTAASTLETASSTRSLRLGAKVDGAVPIAITTIVLRAASSVVSGNGALLQLRYKGLVIASAEVRSATPTDLVFKVPTRIDGGLLDVVFSNAAFASGSDPARQLTLAAVLVNGTSFSPTAAGVSYDLGPGLSAFDGVTVLPGTTTLTMVGALRLPMPAASQIGATSFGSASMLSADPGPYVDASTGLDSQTGTLERPFKTLARLQSLQLLAGENVHLRCGGTWRETLSLGAPQLADGTQIVAYGSDCTSSSRPTISGADRFDGAWIKSGSTWSRAVPLSTPKITRLVMGSTVMIPAQWPNVGAAPVLTQAGQPLDRGRFWIGPVEAAALVGRDLKNAGVMLRTQAWRTEAALVANQGSTGNEMVLAAQAEYAAAAGSAWLLQGKLWMLDAPGEFFHDTAAGRLYVIPTAADAALDLNSASVTIEGSVRDLGLSLQERSRLVVRGLTLRLARQDGLRLTDAPDALVTDIESRDHGGAGLRLWQWRALAAGAAGPRVENSLFTGNDESGIDANHTRNARISANRVLNTGTGLATGPVMAALWAGPGAQVENNLVDGAGYVGIAFSSQAGSLVARNEVSAYCQRLSDCGAIYSWTAPSEVSNLQAALIDGNRISGTLAASTGSAGASHDVVVGIYLDDLTQRVVVRNNLLHGMPMGIFLHNASYNTVEGNRIWLPGQVALWANMDRLDADWMTGNVFRNNQIVPQVRAETASAATSGGLPQFNTAQAVWFWHSLNGEAALSAGRNTFSGNRVVQLQGPLAAHALLRGPLGERYVDALEWQGLQSAEGSPQRPARFAPLNVALGPELVQNGQFDAGLAPWVSYRNPSGTGFSALAVSSLAGCTGPCASFTAGHRGDLLASPPFVMRPGAAHLYRVTAAMPATSSAILAPAYISRETTPWDAMSDSRGFASYGPRRAAAAETLSYEAFFVPKEAALSRVNLQLETLRVAVGLDTVSVREISSYTAARVTDWAALAYAPTGAARTLGCAELGWSSGCSAIDLDGLPVALPLSLAAGTERLLLRADSNFRR